MIQSYHILEYESHPIHSKQKFKDDTILPGSKGTEVIGSILNKSSRMIKSYHILEYRNHHIHYEQNFKDYTILPHSQGPKSSDPFWTKVHGWYNPTTFSSAVVTGSILNKISWVIQSHHILEDRSHRTHSRHISQDDTIPLHSWGPKSSVHFRTSVQGCCNPATFSMTEVTRSVLNKISRMIQSYHII